MVGSSGSSYCSRSSMAASKKMSILCPLGAADLCFSSYGYTTAQSNSNGLNSNFLDEWPHSRTAHASTDPQKCTFMNSNSETVLKLVKIQKMCVAMSVLKVFQFDLLFNSEQVMNFEDKVLLLEFNQASLCGPVFSSLRTAHATGTLPASQEGRQKPKAKE